jgi:hypothetical protein
MSCLLAVHSWLLTVYSGALQIFNTQRNAGTVGDVGLGQRHSK